MSTSNQDKGADARSCPRAQWLIALFWVDRASRRYFSSEYYEGLPPWGEEIDIAIDALRWKASLLEELFEDIPCTVPGCGYCGRPMTRGVAGNKHRDAMDQTFELNGRNFRVVIHEQGTGKNILEWLPASSRDIPPKQLAEWLEEMARRVREGGQ